MHTESQTLHHILSAVIIDGIQRSRTDDDLKARAEAAARALRAGLTAFAATPEPLTSGATNSDAFDKSPVSDESSHEASIVCLGRGPKSACRCSLLVFIRL